MQRENAALIGNIGTRFLRNDITFRDWTPTVTQSSSVAVTVTYARYILIGQVAIIEARLAVTGSGIAGNAIVIGGQPSVIYHGNSNGVRSVIGNGVVLNLGTANYQGSLVSTGDTAWSILGHNEAGGFIGASPSFALANGDEIGFHAVYERA